MQYNNNTFIIFASSRTKIPCIPGEPVCETPEAAVGDTVTYSKMFDKGITVSEMPELKRILRKQL